MRILRDFNLKFFIIFIINLCFTLYSYLTNDEYILKNTIYSFQFNFIINIILKDTVIQCKYRIFCIFFL